MTWPDDFVPFFQLLAALSAAITVGRALVSLFKKIYPQVSRLATQATDSFRAIRAKISSTVTFTETGIKKSLPSVIMRMMVLAT